jgi:hypothetical protein
MSSAATPVKNFPGIANTIPGSGENRSPSRRNHCSRSARNRVRLHPGIVFAFTPESRSPCPGIPSGRDITGLMALNAVSGSQPAFSPSAVHLGLIICRRFGRDRDGNC